MRSSLDEPTTYLDTPTIQALEVLLTSYQGTVLFASHDRRFVSKVATKIMKISQQSITTFDGTYEEYMEYQQKKASEKDAVKDYVEELLQVEMQITLFYNLHDSIIDYDNLYQLQ
ncbi:ABC-F family ATP-binding cassette domain-containing protein [Brevibacterium sp. JNUCC-42]|nr:ABC-F family ATP-binding cassette domain-containing protein [Brevibacterium sp. JNUCC-42]